MAEAVVEIVINNLSSLIQNELGPLMSFNEDLERLKSSLTAIKATLQDAEERQFSQRSINDWLLKLKDAAHMLKVCNSCHGDGGWTTQLLWISMQKIKMISERLDQIAKERHDFHLREIVMDTRTGVMDWRQTTSLITQPQVYGRQQETDNIIHFLVAHASNSQDLSVYPILVLDDVWDDNQDSWQRLRSILTCGAEGASILVTTRLLKVATVLGTMPPHELSMLSGNDCWELFKQRAFESGEEELEELVIIGKEIVKKCAGVPLAAIALGSLLRFKRTVGEWCSIRDNSLRSLQNENSVMPALRLSYLNLPVPLRQCFAFCAIFPKDKIIEKQSLMELWTANGFISSEEECDQVWNELYWRSFFQDIRRNESGKVKSFKMHYLIHDLAQSISPEICCIPDDDGITSVPRVTRHISIYSKELFEKENAIKLHQLRSLKSYLARIYYGNHSLPHDVLKCYSLRVLQYVFLNHLPASIGNLKHLRYLNISHGFFKTLPESICKLRNLQVLKLEGCYKLETLPVCLKQLKALQHL
ncbi:hypothetical protein PIB30_084137 [Stylosanthes scabra]|uniref:Uncharacterized protein n=1 Tax=Stylosanthes scabra TaxID=79078 RepID=A0ABU6STE1_9FABA|nr:hypothetical protein [Stylosanthes scabra]